MSEVITEEEKISAAEEAVAEISVAEEQAEEKVDSELTIALCNAISSASPCGEDPKYNHEFEVVKGEIAKAGARDFDLIADNCKVILTKQAKDITTFAYYVLASAMSQGVEDFCSVIIAFSRVMSEHWENVHPVRERARMNSLSWLNEERTVGMLEKVEVNSSHHQMLVDAKDALEAIKNFTFEKFPDSPPSIKGVVQLVDGWVKKTKVAEAPKPVAPKVTPSAGGASATSHTGTQSSVPAMGEMSDVGSKSDAQKNLQKIALYLLKTEPDNALGFKLLRMVKWQELTAEPKNEGGKTPLAGPIAQRVSHYQNMAQQQQWDGILDKSEAVFTEPGLHFWLDLQYYVCQALEGKGGKFSQCATAVKSEIVALIKRVPTLKDMKFKDDLPFASSQTKEWLDEIESEIGGGSGVPTHFSSVKAQNLEEDLVTAEELLGKGKFDDALHLIQSGCAYGSLKEICERKTVMARMCFQNSQQHIANSLLSELDEQIIMRKLDEWDKDFCIEVWSLHIKVLSAILETPTIEDADKELFKTRLRGVYKRLSNLSPLSVVKLNFI